MLTIGSLFSGIGGLELGLEWAGLGPVIWQCEIDPFCRAVLAKHWPDATRYTDVTAVRDYPHVDLVCGGFPCQDVSAAGYGAGLSGERSSLWWYFARTVEAIRPRVVVVENVASGARRWLPAVRRHLHLLGYNSTAFAISAEDVGAPHLRRRIFILANAHRERGRPGVLGSSPRTQSAREPGPRRGRHVADADGQRQLQPRGCEREERRWAGYGREAVADPDEAGREGARASAFASRLGPPSSGGWAPEPAVGRVAHGLSGGLDGRKRRQRLRALGNSVVPQCAQVVGALIVASLTAEGIHARA